MKILLTNDDGIDATGLWVAAGALAQFGHVAIVAPLTNYSGYGAALPPARSLSYSAYRRPGGKPDNVVAFSLAGTPATCVHVGLSGVFGSAPFDLVVSGINHGANLGGDVYFSGTVGAALTAGLLGVPAVAISLDCCDVGTVHWDAAAWAIDAAVRPWAESSHTTPEVLNINVPSLPSAELRGIMFATLDSGSCLSMYAFRPNPHLENSITVVRSVSSDHVPAPWTDAWVVASGYVAISRLGGLAATSDGSQTRDPMHRNCLTDAFSV